jgi:hypothetical protein
MVIVQKHPRLGKRPRLKPLPAPALQEGFKDPPTLQVNSGTRGPSPTGTNQLTLANNNNK